MRVDFLDNRPALGVALLHLDGYRLFAQVLNTHQVTSPDPRLGLDHGALQINTPQGSLAAIRHDLDVVRQVVVLIELVRGCPMLHQRAERDAGPDAIANIF